MTKCCIVRRCKNSSKKNPDKKFLPFVKPTTDPQRCKRWLELAEKDIPVEKVEKHTYICEDHFKPDEKILDWKLNPLLEPISMHDPNEKKLNREAIPGILLNLALNVRKTYAKNGPMCNNLGSNVKNIMESGKKRPKHGKANNTYSRKKDRILSQCSEIRTYTYSKEVKTDLKCTSIKTYSNNSSIATSCPGSLMTNQTISEIAPKPQKTYSRKDRQFSQKKIYLRKDGLLSRDSIKTETNKKKHEMKQPSLILTCDTKNEPQDTFKLGKSNENLEDTETSLFRDPMIEDIKKEKDEQEELYEQNLFSPLCEIKTEPEEICEDPSAW